MSLSTDQLRSLLESKPGLIDSESGSVRAGDELEGTDGPRRRADDRRKPDPTSFDRAEARLSEVVSRSSMRHRAAPAHDDEAVGRRSNDERFIGRHDADQRSHEEDRPFDGPRPTSTLQRAWIDPEEMPFEPVARPGNPMAARFISWLVVGAFLLGLGWLILPELDLRLRTLETVDLPNGVLTAQAVPLAPLGPSIVSELYVDASSLPDGVLPQGSPIALLESRALDGQGNDLQEIQVPFDARFVSVDTLVGGVVMPGTPVATIYDPSKMYVIVSVQPDTLNLLRRGMRAQLVSDIGVVIEGEVISAVPLLGTDHEPTTADLVNIRIKPDPDTVSDLVPGIRFDALIELTSAPGGAQPLIFTYAGHVDASGQPDSDAGDQNSPENG